MAAALGLDILIFLKIASVARVFSLNSLRFRALEHEMNRFFSQHVVCLDNKQPMEKTSPTVLFLYLDLSTVTDPIR